MKKLYIFIISFPLFFTFQLTAQNQWNIQFSQSDLDCNGQTACYQIELQSASGNTWTLGDQNYRLFFDGDLMTVTSVTSLLPNLYGAANIDQNIKISGQGQEAASPLDDIDDNLGFLDFSIILNDKNNPGAATQIPTNVFIPIAEICIDIDLAALSANNPDCLAFYHSRPSTAGNITSQYIVLSENDTPGTTVATGGANYDDLNSDDGNAACVHFDCASTNSTPPTFTASATVEDITINCDESLPEIPTVTAMDNNGNNVVVNFAEIQEGSGCNQQIIRTWTATDSNGNTAILMQIITLEDNIAPTMTDVPNSLSTDCNNIPAPTNPSVMDNCDDEIEIDFNESQQGSGCNYMITRTWTATDDCNNSTSESQTLTVVDNTPPIITPVHSDFSGISQGDTLIMQCGMTNIFDETDAVVADACDPNPSLQIIEGDILTSTCEDDDFLVFMECWWEATDACGNSSQYLFYVKVVDTTAPQFNNVTANITLACGDAIPPMILPGISDNCSTIANIQITEEENTIPGNCPNTMTIVRTWIAIDECGNSNTATQTIVVEDETAPIINNVPADLTVDESAGAVVSDAPTLTATDICDDDVAVIFAETMTQEVCQRTITRTWTATDDCGNATTQTQIIVVLEDCDDNCVLPEVTDLAVSPTLCNQATGTADIQLVGDETDYTFTWIPNFGTSTSSTDNSRTDLPAGNYLVIMNYLGQSDCEEKAEFTIEDDCPEPPNPNNLPFLVDDTYQLLLNESRSLPILKNDHRIGQSFSLNIVESVVSGELIVHRAEESIEYIPTSNFCNENGIPQYFIYEVCTEAGCDSAKVNLSVLCDNLVIHSGFSPNGDGINDYFVINGIQHQSENILTIFNRLGNKVFTTSNYQNDWDGTYQKNKLPVGTYFYILEVKNQPIRKGYVQIGH